MAHQKDIRQWGEDKLLDAVREVKSTGEGGRNDALFDAACWALKVANAGALSIGEVEERLSAAGAAAGLSKSEIASAMRSARKTVGDEAAEHPERLRRAALDGFNRSASRRRMGGGKRRGRPPPKRPDKAPLAPINLGAASKAGHEVERIPAPDGYPEAFYVARAGEERGWRLVRDEWGELRAHPAELAGAWAAAFEAEREPQAIANLGGKARPGIDPERVGALELARVLPPDVGGLAPWGEAWRATGLRVIVRAWDARGRLASMRARSPNEKRERPPYVAGCPEGLRMRTVGTVLACPLALRMLRGESADVSAVVIVEGVPAWLAWASRHSGRDGRAVIGIYAGGWSPAFAARVPDGATVVCDMDPNEAGDRYRAKVFGSLLARHRAGRLTLGYSLRAAEALEGKPGRSDADEETNGPRWAYKRVPGGRAKR